MRKKIATEFSLVKYQKVYSPERLFAKLSKVAKTIGMKATYAVLLLFYALSDRQVPLRHKAIVIGALGYFIFPADIIPDLLGPLGYSDDTTALIFALKSIWDSITPETHEKAHRQLERWFGHINESELHLF